MNSRKDCEYKTKFVEGSKKWSKKFVHRQARRRQVIAMKRGF